MAVPLSRYPMFFDRTVVRITGYGGGCSSGAVPACYPDARERPGPPTTFPILYQPAFLYVKLSMYDANPAKLSTFRTLVGSARPTRFDRGAAKKFRWNYRSRFWSGLVPRVHFLLAAFPHQSLNFYALHIYVYIYKVLLLPFAFIF